MSCQRVTFYPMVATILATVLHIPLCFLLCKGLDWGIIGLAVATSIKDFFLMAFVVIYGRCSSEFDQTLQPLDKESFEGWCEYLKVSFPTMVMMCAQWWAFEIFIVIAGTLGVNQLAA